MNPDIPAAPVPDEREPGRGDDAATPGPAAAPSPARADTSRALPRTVWALSAVSFFTDFSSEMIYPLLPLFLQGTLGASAALVGAIEGAAESTAALLKLASGAWSDRVARRKPLVVAGYLLASLARPLVAAASSASQVLAIRLTDRVGKGIRSSPRDALIADAVEPSVRGRAFGLHRAADHAGSVAGPLLAFALLQWLHVPLRGVFWLAAFPAAVAMVVLVAGVKEAGAGRGGEGKRDHGRSGGQAGVAAGVPPQHQDGARASESPHHHDAPATTEPRQPLGARFWTFLLVVLLFTLGNSTDAFLLLRANQLGVPAALIPILWAMLHVVKSASSVPGGALSDRLGRRPLLVAGWLLYGAVYFAFGRASTSWHAWLLFAVYGLFFGLTEGTEKALVADLVPAARRGVAFGWYNLAIGLGALPASLIFGAIWDRRGPPAAFSFGALMALLAAALITPVLRVRAR